MNPPGWYPDPTAPEILRWWDGTAWTDHTTDAPGGAAAPTPPGQPPQPSAPPAGSPAGPPAGSPAGPPPSPAYAAPGLPGPAPTGPASTGPAPTGSRTGLVVGIVALVVVLLLVLGVGGVVLARRNTDTAAPPTPTTAPPATPTTAGPGTTVKKGSGTTAPDASDSTSPPSSKKRTSTDRQSLAQRAEAAGIPLLDEEAFATHTHTLVKVVVDGREETIPAGIGIDESAGKIAALHTHADTGVVHVESPNKGDIYTIGQFLTLWGKGNDDDSVCASFVQGSCRVSVDVVDPTIEDQQTFSDFGSMPEHAAEQANGYDTGLVQGAVVVVSIDSI